MSKKAVLWDMDGTLIDSEGLHVASLAAAMRSLDISPPDDLVERVTGKAAEDVYHWLRTDFGLGLGFFDWIKIKYGIYADNISDISPIPSAVALWHQLNAAGIPQAIISNSDRLIVDANMTYVGLNTARLISVSRNDVRNGKPDPEPYLRGAWLLDVDPADCIVLEDSPTGAKGGVAAGMTTFLVPHTEMNPPKGASKLSDMAEVAALCGL